MSARRAAQTLEQVRRILLLMAGGRRRRRGDPESLQLELPFFDLAPAPTEEDAPPELAETNERLHALALELVLLMQMEIAGLVATPLAEGRKRLRLGSLPSLRLLEEWSRVPAITEHPWDAGHGAADRETAYRFGLGAVRALTEQLELGKGEMEEIIRRLHPILQKSTPEDDLAGLIHGHGLRHALVLTTRGRPAFRLDRQRSRGTGVMYTPAELIAEITRTVLDQVAADSGDSYTVCDPACGSGQFLLAAAERMVTAEPERPPRVDRLKQINGVDLDPRAARVAAHNLSVWAARRLGGPDAADQLDRLLGPSFPYLLGSNLRVGDALSLESSAFSPAFRWERRFPEVFDGPRGGFDVVIGNPPWVSHGLRDREGASDEERAYYDRLFPAGAQYKLNLYPLFIELALRICRPGARHGFLVPDSLLAGHHFSRIRDRLLKECDLLELTLLESAPWPGASTGYTVFYAVRLRDGDAPPPAMVRNRILRAARNEQEDTAYVGLDHWVPAAQYGPGQSTLRIFRQHDEVEFQTRMLESPLRMRDVLWSYSGLIARYGQKSAQSERPRDEYILRDVRGREVVRDEQASARFRPALLSGAEVLPYRVVWRGGHLYLPDTRDELPKVWKSGFDLRRYRGPKLFLRQTGDRLIGALDLEGFYCLNNLHLLGPREEVPIAPLFLLGILMSGPMQRLYRIFSPEVSRPLAQVDLKIVESLPYPTDAHGRAIGSAPMPNRSLPQSRRLLRLLEQTVRTAERESFLAMLTAAHAAGPLPLDDGPLSGGEAITLVLGRTLEQLQEEVARQAVGANPSALRQQLLELIDECCGIFFGLPVAEPTH